MSKKSLARLRQDGIEEVWEKYQRDAVYVAKIYDVHYTSVYSALRRYCIENNKNYQSFLRCPHKPHVFKHNGRKKKLVIAKTPAVGQTRFKIRKQPFEVDRDIDFIWNILNTSTPENVEDIRECAHMLCVSINKIKEAI